ncbi:MAG: cytochrome b/b6 domain-containing protein [Erythrobacter sp.]
MSKKKPSKKHALSTRIWHWINAISLIILFMSGLNISNAHRYLYWGNTGFDPADAWLNVIRFPGWATIPGRYDLAEARDWHALAAWPFALALLFMWIAMLMNRHFSHDITTSKAEWRPSFIWKDIIEHAKGNFHHDPVAGKYSFLQKLSYGLVLGIMLPLMIVTGLAISPGFEPAAPWLVDLLGGRQSARSIHFITAFSLLAFFIVHIVLVLITGPFRQIKDMIFGGKA